MNSMFEGAAEFAELLIKKGQEAENSRMNLIMEKEAMIHDTREFDGVLHRWDYTRHMWVKMDVETPKDDPVPDALEFFTLAGLVDYINENNEKQIPDDGSRIILQVENERDVSLISLPTANRKRRNVIAYARAHTPEITFGRYMDTDTFCTELLSKYIETEARKTLFSVAKSMTKEQSATVSDDGVGQQITVKEGVSMASTIQFQNPVPLRPRRTFAEVEQPESNFTLRVNNDANVALFESDGSAWKIDAVNNIRDYLNKRIVNPAVIVIA